MKAQYRKGFPLLPMMQALTTAALVLSLATPALASPESSERSMTFELNFGFYTPNIDAEFGGSATPYQDSFGTDSMFNLGLAIDYEVFKDFGTLAVGGMLRYGWVSGHAKTVDGEESVDETGFKMLPLTAFIAYRWDWAQVHHGIPLVPYVRLGLTWTAWWSTDGKGDVSNWVDANGEQRAASGGTWGWQVAGGLQLLLDALSPGMARDMDEETGINNTYLFGEVQYQELDDFGSDNSFDLGATSFHFGLKFEF